MEGRIETFSDGAETLFGWRADEVVGKKRVSLFSPGLVVLGHVPGWLKAAAESGRFETRTVFLRKDGTPFAADITLGVAATLAAAAAGAFIACMRGPALLLFGAAGLFLGYFYTAPPLRLVARRGLGELSVALAFGPLMTAGTAFALTGHATAADFLVGLPVGLLTAAILFINEFPDAGADAAAGKNQLVVTLGKARARWGYVALLAGAFLADVALVVQGLAPRGALLMFAALPLGLWAARILFAHYDDRRLVGANAKTIQLQLAAGLAMAAGLLCASDRPFSGRRGRRGVRTLRCSQLHEQL